MQEILKLEETIKDMRVAYARQICPFDTSELTDEDYLGIYEVFLTKARIKEKNIDNK